MNDPNKSSPGHSVAPASSQSRRRLMSSTSYVHWKPFGMAIVPSTIKNKDETYDACVSLDWLKGKS